MYVRIFWVHISQKLREIEGSFLLRAYRKVPKASPMVTLPTTSRVHYDVIRSRDQRRHATVWRRSGTLLNAVVWLWVGDCCATDPKQRLAGGCRAADEGTDAACSVHGLVTTEVPTRCCPVPANAHWWGVCAGVDWRWSSQRDSPRPCRYHIPVRWSGT